MTALNLIIILTLTFAKPQPVSITDSEPSVSDILRQEVIEFHEELADTIPMYLPGYHSNYKTD